MDHLFLWCLRGLILEFLICFVNYDHPFHVYNREAAENEQRGSILTEGPPIFIYNVGKDVLRTCQNVVRSDPNYLYDATPIESVSSPSNPFSDRPIPSALRLKYDLISCK
ncbi:hypothetical protein DPMN_162986 [Dreissena polymorpha]|uniref:Uncharacterized protein n=1 Tax=Dreissena polymorpha TaxID=45954 RepID=A0A9D4EQD3_DREPO|nr:hypothetical protein DPMN_162986 [Dreissena polymorpha]